MLAAYKTRSASRIANITSRNDLSAAQRIVIKVGTSMVVGDDGYPHLRQIANICEEIVALRREGRDVVLVSSGAIGIGRNIVARQEVLMTSVHDQLHRAAAKGTTTTPIGGIASIGQTQLSNLYYTLFRQLDQSTSDILLTKYDFETEERCENLVDTIETCLAHGVCPVLNENDTTSCKYNKLPSDVFVDNDGLAALVAGHLRADLLIILTDVEGVYDRPPQQPGARVIPMLSCDASGLQFGTKSSMGRGGMEAKVAAAQRAVAGGVPGVAIVTGRRAGMIRRVIAGDEVGTLVVKSLPSGAPPVEDSVHRLALAAKAGSLVLSQLSGADRARIVAAVADALEASKADILAANLLDLEAADKGATPLASALRNRLELSEKKLVTLCAGIRALAAMPDPIGRVRSRTLVADGVTLEKITTPIGVLLVIFESRPDSLPQIAALSLISGNGLLLKGGREAKHTNAKLHAVIGAAVEVASGGRVPASVIGLVSSREDVATLLQLSDVIDLVIPRGGKALVENVQRNTRIPVLGHADGICHVFVHAAASIERAVALVLDAKTQYPAACNAAETLLLDAALPGDAQRMIVDALVAAGVTVYGGPRALEAGLATEPVADFHTEYGDLRISVEIVDSLESAVAHINKFGSHHTDVIVTEDGATATKFISSVDSACVFHNASSRMADGYRFGLGAEVGISTSRIHARGPVGVEGLLSEKWVMVDSKAAPPCGGAGVFTTAGAFEAGAATFVHASLPAASTSN